MYLTENTLHLYDTFEILTPFTEKYFLGFCAVNSGRTSPTFRGNLLSPSSGSKSKSSKQSVDGSFWAPLQASTSDCCACWLLPYLHLLPWRWRQQVTSKRGWYATGLHGVTSQKTAVPILKSTSKCMAFPSTQCADRLCGPANGYLGLFPRK
jgi:hypothetical protein